MPTSTCSTCSPPFASGGPVTMLGGDRATVIRTKHDRHGWRVLVLCDRIIDGQSDPIWVDAGELRARIVAA